MVTISRQRVIQVGKELKLWEVEDTEAWRTKARAFIEDEAAIQRASGQIRGFNLTPTSGPALVDLLIQAHVCDNDGLKRMSKANAESFNVETVKFTRKKRRARALAGEPAGERCQATTLRGEACRNSGKYDGFCCVHAPKCQFYEVTGKRCTTRAVNGDLCPKHAHRRFDLDEERENLTEKERAPSINSPGRSSELVTTTSMKTSPGTLTPPRRVCKGKKLKVGKKRSDEADEEDCLALAMKGSDYCRHHHNQSTGLSLVVNADLQEEQQLVCIPVDSSTETSELDETQAFNGESTSPCVNAKRTCHGKSRITGKSCGQRAQKDSAYCRFHQDQDPYFETDKLATNFREIRTLQEQKNAIEILDDIDEYAVATYTLTKKSNNRMRKLTSSLGLSKEKTRRVDLTIYPSGVIFLYPDMRDNEEGKILGKFKLQNLEVEVVPETRDDETRTVRFKYLRSDGAPQKDFVNVKRETAQEIKNIVNALKNRLIEKARELADGSSKKEPPYRRWLDQVLHTADVDKGSDLREILYCRSGQMDNQLEDGFVEELDADGKSVVFWWGSSRNNRTGRKIGNANEKKEFCKELRTLLIKDVCVEDSAMLTEGVSTDDSRNGNQEVTSGTMEGALRSRTYGDWFEAAVDECKQKAAHVGKPGDFEYQHELTALLTKKFLMDKRERLVSQLDAFQRDGVYWWDPDCQKFPIGDSRHLEPFSLALEQVFPDHYKPNGVELLDGQYVQKEKTRPSWPEKTKKECWDKLRNPVSGVLCKAFASAFDVEPASDVATFVNDQNAPDSEFRVDMYGNVVAKPGAAGLAPFSVCYTEYDHVLPWSRGGTSQSRNVEVISWIANRRKSNYFLHGTDYVQGWSTASKPLNAIGLSVEQFVSLWLNLRDTLARKTGTQARLTELRSSKLGKRLVEDILYKTCAMENSWKLYRDVLAGGSTNMNGEYEQILPARPRGELLKTLLAFFATADDAEEAARNARKYMMNDAAVINSA